LVEKFSIRAENALESFGFFLSRDRAARGSISNTLSMNESFTLLLSALSLKEDPAVPKEITANAARMPLADFLLRTG
jgi:hypothetical protein